MNNKMVQLSEVWLFGTRRMLMEWDREKCFDYMSRTLPDGRLVEKAWMTEEETNNTLDTGFFDDGAWKRWCKKEL